MNNASINVGIVGATGAVGQELLRLLHDRNFPMASLRLFASARSAGKVAEYAGKKYTIEEAKPGVFAGVDVAFFAAGGSVTRALAPDAVKSGCLVIDKSSHYRMDPDVPLVIPEINPEGLRSHKGIIANPNCSTAVTLMARVWPPTNTTAPRCSTHWRCVMAGCSSAMSRRCGYRAVRRW